MEFPVPDLTLITPVIVVFGWASLLLLIDVFFIPEGNKQITGFLALAGLVVALITAILLWGTPTSTTFCSLEGNECMIVLDSLALLFSWIFLIAAILTIAVSLQYLSRHGMEQGEFYPLILFGTGALMLMVQSTNLILIFLVVELLSITLYILTGFGYPRLPSEEAAMKYLILGAFAAGFFVYGIALVYGATGTVDLSSIGSATIAETVDSPVLLAAGSALILISLAFKIGLVPFHMWTPDVYEGAPTPVTAFMSVGTKAAASAVLLRLLTMSFPTLDTYWIPVLGGLAILTMIVGNIGAIAQTNVKRMLAYSSVGHAGYLLLGVMAAAHSDTVISHLGVQAFIFYLVAYTLTNLGAFGVLIALEERGESAWHLNDFSGLWHRQPLLAIAMAVFMISLAGVPTTAGFIGKFFVFMAAWEANLGLLAVVGVLASAVAAFFYLRVVVRMFMHDTVREIPPMADNGVRLTVAIAMVATVVFGILPSPILSLTQQTIALAGL